jgi:hypothetical protein
MILLSIIQKISERGLVQAFRLVGGDAKAGELRTAARKLGISKVREISRSISLSTR